MADATLQLLRDLDDPRKFHRVEGVPVFTPHALTKRGSDGRAQDVKVTEKDLKKIAEHCNSRAEKTGTLAVVTLGHRLQDRDVPEQRQPRPVGYAKNWRVARFGPGKTIGLICDTFIRQEDRKEAGSYGFRSVEYYKSRNEITAVCLLRRDPELDLGVTSFQADGPLLCYSREVQYMAADPTMAPDPDMTMDAPMEAPMPAAEDNDGDEMDRYAAHCMAHPYGRKLHGMMTKYAGEPAGGAPPAMPSATNGVNPGAPEPEQPLPFARQQQPASYARVQAEVRALKAKLEKSEKERAKAQHDALMLQYQAELVELTTPEGGGYVFDVEEELPLCTNYSRADMDAHKARLMRICKQDPTGGTTFVDVVQTPGVAPKLTEKRLDEVLSYARANGITVEEAHQKVLGGKAA